MTQLKAFCFKLARTPLLTSWYSLSHALCAGGITLSRQLFTWWPSNVSAREQTQSKNEKKRKKKRKKAAIRWRCLANCNSMASFRFSLTRVCNSCQCGWTDLSLVFLIMIHKWILSECWMIKASKITSVRFSWSHLWPCRWMEPKWSKAIIHLTFARLNLIL